VHKVDMLGNMMVTQSEKVKDELILERYDIELLGVSMSDKLHSL